MTTAQHLLFARMGLRSITGCLAAAGPAFTPYLAAALLRQLALVGELEARLVAEGGA